MIQSDDEQESPEITHNGFTEYGMITESKYLQSKGDDGNNIGCSDIPVSEINDGYDQDSEWYYTVLGRPALITDVLRYLKLCAIDNHGQLCPAMGGTEIGAHYKPKLNGIKFNLSKPHLKDQSEETITNVARLMNIELWINK